MPRAAGVEQWLGLARWRNREVPTLNGSSNWTLKSPKMMTAQGWRASQKVTVLVKSAMNDGCYPGWQWVPCNKDGGDMEFRGAGAFEEEGG